MSLATDLRILYRLVAAPVRGKTHAERLESFYRHQARDYDQFRERLLHGRKSLYEALPTPSGGHWIEMGGGTGSNLEYLGNRIHQLERVTIVDLSSSLLQRASERCSRMQWNHTNLVEADVTQVDLPPADVVTFSYSLTMIPNWFEAIERALKLLKPGGSLGVVDFYVSRKHPEPGRKSHSWITRSLWPLWFSSDNVHLSADHLPYLIAKTQAQAISEFRGSIPFLPLVKVPYYTYIGRKPF